MNFTFMIYVLLGLLLYFQYKLNIKSIIMLAILFLILVLNEIYNNSNYNRKDLFVSESVSEYVKNYKFDKTLDPYEYSRVEFKTAIIPNVFNDDTHLRDGLMCASQKDILDEKLKSKKLDYQAAYVNKLSDVIFPRDNNSSKNIESLIKGTSMGLNFEEDLNPNVFNPIYENEFTKDKKCPTVCHIISDESKCRFATDIPTFENEADFNNWKNGTLDKCGLITDRYSCIIEKDCSFDDVFAKCYYDKRKCISHSDINDKHECHTRCDFMNDPSNLEKSKMDCDSAKFYNGDNYCEWNLMRKKCVPKCELYNKESDCVKSPDCIFVGGKCINL